MKKLVTLMLGLGLVLGTVSFAFADDAAPAKEKKVKKAKVKKAKKTTEEKK
jgi:hypothetical protein